MSLTISSVPTLADTDRLLSAGSVLLATGSPADHVVGMALQAEALRLRSEDPGVLAELRADEG